MQPKTIRLRTYFGVLLALWTFSVTGLFVKDALHIRQNAKDLSFGAAQAYLNTDQAIRLWASSHGGVYVPVSDQTQSNSYLSHVIDRDISTPSGTRLTLMNPAYMIRQVMEHYAGLYDVRGRITSLRHFRAETAPDEWESRMLSSFESGSAEALEFSEDGGEPRLRLMRALFAEESCLKCHWVQGERRGGVRGGISASVPLHEHVEYGRKETLAHALSFGLLWAFGVGVIGCVGKRLSNSLREQDRAKVLLRMWQDNYQKLIGCSMTGIYISQDNTIIFANTKFAEIHGFSIEEILDMNSLSLVAPEDRDAAEEMVNKRLDGVYVPDEYEIRCTTKSEKPIWVQSRGPDARERTRGGMPSRAGDLKKIIDDLATRISAVREMTKRLSPLIVNDLGLVPAIEWLCRSLSQTSPGIRIQIDIQAAEEREHPRLVESRHFSCPGKNSVADGCEGPREPLEDIASARQRFASIKECG